MARSREPDDLDRTIDELERISPGTKAKVEALAELAMLRHKLRLHRAHLGLTQADVARRMGISQAAVSQLESGADVTVSKLARYLHALGLHDWHERIVAK